MSAQEFKDRVIGHRHLGFNADRDIDINLGFDSALLQFQTSIDDDRNAEMTRRVVELHKELLDCQLLRQKLFVALVNQEVEVRLGEQVVPCKVVLSLDLL